MATQTPWYVPEKLLTKNYRLEVEDLIGKWFFNLLSGIDKSLDGEEVKGFIAKDKRHKFQSTLAQDLYNIADEMGKPFEECGIKIESINLWRVLEEVCFTTKGYSEAKVRKHIKLDSLKIIRESMSNIRWEADYHEFKEKFESPKIEYGNHLRVLADFVKENYHITDYHYVFNKYEDSINIVLNTVREDKQENSGIISDEILEKSQLIINRFEVAFDEKKEEIKLLDTLQSKATQKSLIGRLDSELEFIDKFIEA